MRFDTFYEILRKNLSEKKLNLKIIGYVGHKKNYPIFSIINKLDKKRKTICILSGIHGDEIAPPIAMLSFIKKFNFDESNKFNLIFIPIANPIGFENKKRENYQNIDLNRRFSDKKLLFENKIIYNYLKKYKIYFFCAMHEDLDENEFYMYIFEKKKQNIYREIINLSKKHFKIKNGSVEGANGHLSENGLIRNLKVNDGSVEYRLFHEGSLFSMCTETPGKKKLSQRVKLNEKIIEKILKALNRKVV